MSKTSYVAMIMLFTVALILGGCGQTAVPEGEEPAADLIQTEAEGQLVVIDQMGREVVIDGIPQRLISLSPSNTEIAFALGLSERIVGVTEYCNYPPEAQEKELIGGFATPNIERIVELEPDLVLASTIHEEAVTQFEALGITVLVIESATLTELYTSISLMAELTGVSGAGEALIASMQSRIGAVEEQVASIPEAERVKVYYEVYSDPLMSAGKQTFINEIITLAGGINIFADIDESYPQISAEVVAERQPQVILYPDYHGTAEFVLESMVDRPGWSSIPAVADGKVYAASDDAFARPGPRVVEAVEEAARLFYPQLFSQYECDCCD
jgi:iron complex transport system substrate-binding protein